MRRGFKAEAERAAAGARAELGIDPMGPLSPWRYAEHLGVRVLDFEKLALPEAHRRQLLVTDPDSWSGLTLREGSTIAVVINPSHPPARQCSTLMHELAHVLLRHVPARVDISSSGLLLLSDYSEDQEGEADWMGAALLLPRNALILHRSRGASTQEIAATFCISEALAEWRLRMTGADVQLRRTGQR